MRAKFGRAWAGLALALVAGGSAWSYDLIRGPEGELLTWNDGPVPVVIRMSTAANLEDGTNHAMSVQAALQAWNANLQRMQFAPQIEAPGFAGSENGINEAAFDSKIYSNEPSPQEFGANTLAVTITLEVGAPRADGSYPLVERDVLFNTAHTWNSYRGELQVVRQDIRRVAIHEFGHVLGLDHPDQNGQSVSALMNSIVSNVDALRPDDINGAQFMYGKPGGFTAPANDHFANATVLPATSSVTLSASSIGATKEPGEPDHAADEPGGASVWWRWTAIGNGSITVHTQGSWFDTTLAVYRGDSLTSLTRLAANDDVQRGVVRTSSVTLPVKGQEVFYIAVDGWAGEWGQITFSLSYEPGPGPQVPYFNQHPASQTVAEGNEARLSVMPRGDPWPTVQWQRRAAGTEAWQNLTNDDTFANVTESTLWILSTAATMNGDQYRCVATNPWGSTPSEPATLTVTPSAPVVVTHPPTQVYAAVGTTAVISAQVRGTAPLSYQWLRNYVELPGETNPTLSVPVTAQTNNQYYLYQLRITNPYGSVQTNSTRIWAVTQPIITTQPRGFTAVAGSSSSDSSLTVQASGSHLTFKWYRNGQPLSSSNSSDLGFGTIRVENAGDYYVVASNEAGSVTSETVRIVVIPQPAPRLSAPQGYGRVALGESFSFSISDFAKEWGSPVSVQWYRNGVAVPGATYTSLSVSAATMHDYGRYYATVTNAAGTAVSDTVELSMIPRAPNWSSPRWTHAVEFDGVAYFLFAQTPRIERYDLARKAWLTPWVLSGLPRALAVTSDAVYVAHETGVTKYTRSFTGGTLFATGDARHLIVRGDHLLVTALNNYGLTRLLSMNRHTGEVLSDKAGITGQSAWYSEPAGKLWLFEINQGGSDRFLYQATWAADGTLGDPAYAGSTNSVTLVRSAAGGERFIQNSGVVSSAHTGETQGTLGTPAHDLFEQDGIYYVLRAGRVTAYSAVMREMGSASFQIPAEWFTRRGNEVIGFGQPADSASKPSVGVLSLSTLQPEPLPATVDPEAITAWYPKVEIADGIAYIYSKLHGNVFRWSIIDRQWLPTVPVTGWPNIIAVSSASQTLFHDAAAGAIRAAKWSGAAPVSEPVVSLSSTPQNFQTASEYLLVDGRAVLNQQGQVVSRSTYSPDFSKTYTWNAATRRMYHFYNSAYVAFTPVAANGALGNYPRSPYIGLLHTAVPLRVSADGSRVVIGHGHVLDGQTLQLLHRLPTSPVDAAWRAQTLHTLDHSPDGARVATWNGTTLVRSAEFSGYPVRLAAVRDDLLFLVTTEAGKLRLRLLAAATLTELPPEADLNRPPTASFTLSSARRTGETVTIALTVGDPDENYSYANLWVQTPARSWLTIRADNGIVTSGDLSAAHTVAFQPGTFQRTFTFADGAGEYRFVLQAVDSAGISSPAVEMQVTVEAPPPLSGFESWRADRWSARDLNDATLSGALADPDGDGHVNLLEYALDSDPLANASVAETAVSLQGGEWQLVFSRPSARDDLEYAVESSTDLVEWSSAGVVLERIGTGEIEVWRARCAASTQPQFLRLRVTRQ